MNEANYHQETCRLEFVFQGVTYITPYTDSTYESRAKLYTVRVRNSDGAKSYHVNGGFATEPCRIHRAIEAFYSHP